MTWRELWKSTVTNLRALLGISPPSSSRFATSRPPASTPAAPLVKRKAQPLAGPVVYSTYSPSKQDGRGDFRGDHTDDRAFTNHTIDLAATRQLPSPTAPLRRKPFIPPIQGAPVDLALDDAAFASMHMQRAEIVPIMPNHLPAPYEIHGPTNGIDGTGAVGDNGFEPEAPGDDAMAYPGGAFSDDDDPSGKGPDDHLDDEGANGFEPEDDGIALTTLLESLLFVASEPVDPRQLAQTLDQSLEVIELGLAELADYYARSLRGLRVQRFNNKVQLVTAPVAAPFIELFLNLDNSTRLSTPALETLAVIAYRQPVTRAQIEAVRGVDCAGVLRTLVQRGLVAEMGRVEGIGRPILYGVTELFMQHFGLMELAELPPLEETDADRLWAATVMDDQAPGSIPAKPQ